MSKPPFHSFLVEESDVGICMDGWDNFLLHDTTELQEYFAALKYLGAARCAAVIAELLDLVATTSPECPIDVTESQKEQLDELWRRYRAASEAEDPQGLSKRAFEAV
jgi:hypothetical protein